MKKLLLAAALIAVAAQAQTKIRPCEGQAGVNRLNPDNSIGGFVANTAKVSKEAYLGTEAQVCDSATLTGEVKVLDRSIVSGRADLRGSVVVSGGAYVYGEATLWNTDGGGELTVMDDARIYGSAFLNGSVMVTGTSEIFGAAQILDFVQVHGASKICARSILSEDLIITDDTTYCPAK